MKAPAWSHTLLRRVGHRGGALLVFGAFDFVYGWTRLINPDPLTRASEQLQVISHLFPFLTPDSTLTTWGWMWWLAGAFCIVNAFRIDDRWGYGMAIGIKISWLGANAYVWSQGVAGGGSATATWLFVLALCSLLAFRAEPITEVEPFILPRDDMPQPPGVPDAERR